MILIILNMNEVSHTGSYRGRLRNNILVPTSVHGSLSRKSQLLNEAPLQPLTLCLISAAASRGFVLAGKNNNNYDHCHLLLNMNSTNETLLFNRFSIMYNLSVFTCIILIFVFHCTHVRMSYVLNAYLLAYSLSPITMAAAVSILSAASLFHLNYSPTNNTYNILSLTCHRAEQSHRPEQWHPSPDS